MIGPLTLTTFAAIRFAVEIASRKECPIVRMAMTEPMWESPAPIVSTTVACLEETKA